MKTSSILKWLCTGVTAAVLLSGCGAKDNTPIPKPLVKFKQTLPVQVLFNKRLTNGSHGKWLNFGPAVSSKWIVADGATGDVVALNRKSLKTVWSINLKQPLSTSPSIAGAHVFIGGLNGWLYALNIQTGKLQWQSKAGSAILARPVSDGNTVVVHVHNGNIAAFDAQKGQSLWTYSGSSPDLILEKDSAPAIDGSNVLVGFNNGMLASFKLKSGQMNWERPIAIPTGSSQISQMVDIKSQPLLSDETVFESTYHGNLVALDAQTASVFWLKPISSYQNLALSGNHLLVTDEKGQVLAYNSTTGKKLWTQNAFNARFTTAPAVLGKTVLVGDYAGYLHFLSLKNGQQLAQVQVSGSGISTQPVVLDGKAYVTTDSGRLVILKAGA